jgi:glyoxylase-like metal-dependent hydrolase (beta-lactamase superfamily II)
MTIIPLSEGTFTIDKTKVFVPFEAATEELNSRPTGSLLIEVQPFVVKTTKDILLLDAGLGFARNGRLRIHENLSENGIQPGDITKVLMTHLHKDHAGGVSMADKLGNYSLAFPNATYYIQKAELDFALETGFPSFMAEELNVLINHSQVQLLHGDGMIDDYIDYKIIGGHSPYHQVFWIKEEGEIIFFGGDEAPQYQQMKSKFMPKYDYDGKKSMLARQAWWEQGKQEDWTFLFYHDVKTPVWPVL